MAPYEKIDNAGLDNSISPRSHTLDGELFYVLLKVDVSYPPKD